MRGMFQPNIYKMRLNVAGIILAQISMSHLPHGENFMYNANKNFTILGTN